MRENNIKIFEDFQKHINNNDELLRITKEAQKNTRLYKEQDRFILPNKRATNPIIRFYDNYVLDGVQRLIKEEHIVNEKIAILNFASATNPGGGVTTGANAQEESLCRESNLYNCLNQDFLLKNYYYVNRKNNDVRKHYKELIYSKNIYFKTLGQKHCDVITMAALNLNRFYLDKKSKSYADILYEKILRIIQVAANNQVDYLILGAFGCGVFKNDPELTAKMFFKVLIEEDYQKYFKGIIFTIPVSHKDDNSRIFKNVFIKN